MRKKYTYEIENNLKLIIIVEINVLFGIIV